MSNDVLETVKRFATALDDEDYRALESLLAADCRYESPRGTLVGLLAVIGSYREGAAWVKGRIQHVRYQSSIREEHDGTATATFLDLFEHDGRRHTYACEQRVSLDAHGRICRIVHIELPQQRDDVDAFLRSIGVEPRT